MGFLFHDIKSQCGRWDFLICKMKKERSEWNFFCICDYCHHQLPFATSVMQQSEKSHWDNAVFWRVKKEIRHRHMDGFGFSLNCCSSLWPSMCFLPCLITASGCHSKQNEDIDTFWMNQWSLTFEMWHFIFKLTKSSKKKIMELNRAVLLVSPFNTFCSVSTAWTFIFWLL